MKTPSMIKYTAAACLLSLSAASTQAATVWLVESGAASNSNSPGTTLEILPEGGSYDLYVNFTPDTAYGWDVDLTVTGTGLVSNVTGDNLDIGAPMPNGGWGQIGGDIFGEGGEILLFSFDFSGTAGSTLTFSGSYTDDSFSDAPFPTLDIVSVSEVPLPASGWLLASALGALLARRRSPKRS